MKEAEAEELNKVRIFI